MSVNCLSHQHHCVPCVESHTNVLGFYIPVYSAVALSAVTGQVLWKKFMSESVMSIQCGLQYSSQPLPVCLLISKSVIMAVNGTTGEKSTTCSDTPHVCVCVCVVPKTPPGLKDSLFLSLRKEFVFSPTEEHRIPGSVTSRPAGGLGARSAHRHFACQRGPVLSLNITQH